jgi:hypothetical protein
LPIGKLVPFLAFLHIGRIAADAPPKCALEYHDDDDGMETKRRNMM